MFRSSCAKSDFVKLDVCLPFYRVELHKIVLGMSN